MFEKQIWVLWLPILSSEVTIAAEQLTTYKYVPSRQQYPLDKRYFKKGVSGSCKASYKCIQQQSWTYRATETGQIASRIMK